MAKSFGRIHETNLKKQGVLPLWFSDPSDYGRIGSGDVVETVGIQDLILGDMNVDLKLRVTPRVGSAFMISVKHTMSEDQVKWLKAGSALNYIRSLGK